MANREHLKRLREGKQAWKAWRAESSARPNLREARLEGRDLSGFDLSGADLRGAHIRSAQMRGVNLEGADLSGCIGRFVRLSAAKLAGANLEGADLRGGSLRRADLTGANLKGAVLRFTSMVEANVEGADLRGAEIYGVGAWNLKGEPKNQAAMIIQENREAQPTSADDLDTAQFLTLLLDNPKIADVIETASRRVVLLLGRFKPRYKKVLDALKQRLGEENFVPVLFDFRGPGGRDLTETVATIAHLACFVVADLSGVKSVPQELSYIVPYLPSVPVVPLLQSEDGDPYSMFEHFQRYPWVQEVVTYRDVEDLLSRIDGRYLDRIFATAMKARRTEGVKRPKVPRTQARSRASDRKGTTRRKSAAKRTARKRH